MNMPHCFKKTKLLKFYLARSKACVTDFSKVQNFIPSIIQALVLLVGALPVRSLFGAGFNILQVLKRSKGQKIPLRCSRQDLQDIF